ncbi:MAG: hypothetical protein ACOCU5_02375 [Bacillota bacterium]
MLSKRGSDLLFLGVIVLMLAGIVTGRFMILSTMDDRIEEVESENATLETEIRELENLVADHQQEQLPTMAEMHREIPAYYDRDQLSSYVYTQLELEGISSSESRNLSVDVSEASNFPEDSTFRELSEQLDAYRIQVEFNSDTPSEVSNFTDRMQSQDQLFILESVRYDQPEDEPMPIRLNFITFYYPSEE